ncbi:hypothetical protein [Rhizobium sp. C1]|uniref:hypothetical protein n=1 Tax=Rhizobium sp. C1 TaxID=1349799 RepID=UPI001E438013|nr:hypothetical protein [Rhizobium sp. C1]MCD2176466.1 hypothetical protein [Rhizobium sp. C1]
MKETGLYPIVSDHAVLRYLERCHGLNVEVIRAQIRESVRTGVRYGASAVITDGVKYVLREETVVTVHTRGGA